MAKTQRQRTKQTAPAGSTRAKGDLVEHTVAEMHKVPGVIVQKNVFLPMQDGSNRHREIDVLLTINAAGYPIRLAIECKNEIKPTGVGQIDAFIGKLQDVGIPHGIFVSASKYTKDAIYRAKKGGIRPLLLKNSNLPKAVLEAFQSVIYLLLEITNIEIANDMPGLASAHETLFFRDDKDQICGGVPDLVWLEWLNESIEAKIGKTKLTLTLPSGWLQVVNGDIANVYKIEAEIQVYGYAVAYPGEVQNFILMNASDSLIEKSHTKVTFPIPEGTFPITRFLTEDELTKYVHSAPGIRVSIGRFRVPRIVYRSMYWPISEKTAQKFHKIANQEWEQGQEPDFSKFTLEDMEGDDLAAAWEPIWREHPLVINRGSM